MFEKESLRPQNNLLSNEVIPPMCKAAYHWGDGPKRALANWQHLNVAYVTWYTIEKFLTDHLVPESLDKVTGYVSPNSNMLL
ncbi:hypothetical protein TSUD_382940 [Trifolium subterraneum]|uniref:Uncharacterized protein n=1 Tax=Trifolium subterraneum TaxID=3900 RepID=A0A2Z6NMB4_TRISU|nr:hypothetical protein TSUD_382940 [Trifolium subterraneum]